MRGFTADGVSSILVSNDGAAMTLHHLMRHLTMSLALFGALTAHAWAPTWPELTTPTSTLAMGHNDAAVVVAVEKSRHLAPIPGAARNGADWHLWLTRDHGIPARRVRVLQDAEVTREGILAAVRFVAATVDVGGRVWFVFIGHGAPDPTSGDGLLLGADAALCTCPTLDLEHARPSTTLTPSPLPLRGRGVPSRR